MSQHKKKYNLYGIGSALLDMEVSIDDAFCERLKLDKGHMTLVDQERQAALLAQLDLKPEHIKRACGGSAANTIISNSCFGERSFFSCVLGEDEDGKFYRDNLKKLKVDSNARLMQAQTTGKCLVMITPDGERTMNTFLGVNQQLDASIVDETALANSEYLYLESYLIATDCGFQALISACTLAKKHNIKIALSLSDPSIINHFGERIRTLLDEMEIAIVFANEAEVLGYTREHTLAKALQNLAARVVHIVVTRGAKGAIIQHQNQTVNIVAHPATVVDTNGAGDIFAGAYLYGISHGFSIAQSGDFAAFCASRLISHYGPRLAPQEYRVLLEHLA